MRLLRLAVVVLGGAVAVGGCSGAAAPGEEAEQAVRDIVQAQQDALNARDWDAFFANFSEESDLVVFESPRAEGRAAARALMEQGWSDAPDDVRAELSVASVRFPTPEVAVADIEAEFSGSQPSRDRATAVLTSREGRWLVDAFRIMQPAPVVAFVDDLPDAVAADPGHYSVEFENSLVRVLRITYAPGTRSTLHRHPASCAVYLTGGTFEFTLPNGTTTGGAPTAAGSVSCADAEAHLPENVGAAPAEVVLLELKGRESLAP